MSNDIEKAKILVGYALNFDKDLPEILMELWLEMIEKWTLNDLKLAVTNVIKSHKYANLPPFAVLQQAHDKVTGHHEISPKDLAGSEWRKLLDTIQSVGRYGNPQGLNQTTSYVLRLMGGWTSACSWTNKEISFIRKEFIQHWIDVHEKEYILEFGADIALKLTRGNSEALGQSERELTQ